MTVRLSHITAFYHQATQSHLIYIKKKTRYLLAAGHLIGLLDLSLLTHFHEELGYFLSKGFRFFQFSFFHGHFTRLISFF